MIVATHAVYDQLKLTRLEGELAKLRAENERLRQLLQACIKSAEADGDLKESGWWDEQSIIAIENARAELADQGKG